MATVRYKKGEVPVELSPEQEARLDAMTPGEIEANALSDPDNPPATDEELERAVTGRNIRLLRERMGLSQADFAARYQIGLARLRDWEQGRHLPDSAARAYLRVIARHPALVEAAIKDPLDVFSLAGPAGRKAAAGLQR